MSQFNTIVFDLGGVLVDWSPDYVYKSIFPNEADMKWFYQNICTPDWNEEQDAGRSLKDATEELVIKFPEQEKNIRAYYDRWEEMLGGPIPETVEILRYLRHNTSYRLYALTNWSFETFPIALQRFDFLHWFDGRIVSGEERTKKPFKEIYQMLIDRFQINPSTAIYTDDNVRNLIPAEELGMHAIHFTSPEQFRQELQLLKILP